MKIFSTRNVPFVASALLVLLCFGCSSVLPQPQTDTTRHFTLSAPTSVPAAFGGTRVQPVRVAGHLRSRAMAVRIAESEIIYLDDVVWAETLADGITQTLRNRLASVADEAVIHVQIQRCELNRAQGNKVELVATYTISTGGSAIPIEHRGLFSASSRTWDGKDYGALVGLLRDAVGELADRLVGQLAEKTK